MLAMRNICGGNAPLPEPADTAPEVPRGRLLRDRTLMRVLAVERVVRGWCSSYWPLSW